MAKRTKSAPRPAIGVLPEKKRKREARIVQSASDLFARDGYAETSIDAIARRADVAVGTVYNYFQNKPALLMRVLTSGKSKSLQASTALAKAQPYGPVEAIYHLVYAQMQGANHHDKKLWRVIHATAALEPKEFGLDYFIGKEQFTDHIIQLLQTLHDRGQTQEGINIQIAAKTITYIASEVFRRYVANDYISIDDAASDLKLMIKFVVGRAVKT